MVLFMRWVGFRHAAVVLAASLLALAVAGPVRADLGAWDEDDLPQVYELELPALPLSYEEDEEATESRIIIPYSVIRQAGFGAGEGFGGNTFGGFVPLEPSRMLQTILAGLMLSAAAVSLVLVMRRRAGAKVALATMLLSAGLLAAGDFTSARPAIADDLPGFVPPAEVQEAYVEPEGIEANGAIVIQHVGEGSVIRFIRGTATE